jgi:adenylate cyclase
MTALRTAYALDPLSPIFGVQLASLHYLRREFAEAAALCRDLVRVEPDFWPAHWFGGVALEQQGRTDEAARALESATAMSNRSHFALAALGHLLATSDRSEEARRISAELMQRRASEHVSAAALALVHAGLGENGTALSWLEQARAEQSPFLRMFLAGDPRLDGLRAAARFRALSPWA